MIEFVATNRNDDRTTIELTEVKAEERKMNRENIVSFLSRGLSEKNAADEDVFKPRLAKKKEGEKKGKKRCK